MYHPDPRVNDIVLTIINDGNGSQCGMDYRARCNAAATGILRYRAAVAEYGRRAYGRSMPTRSQIIEAADVLQHYYRAHVEEMKHEEKLRAGEDAERAYYRSIGQRV